MTTIEWTDATWNPIVGCSRVSAGCEHCYAERVAHRGLAEQHRGLTVVGRHGPRWNGTVRFVPAKLGEPLRWRKPRRVFVNSMSDLFHEGVSDEQIAAIFGVMAACPQHTFQVLTKRPERARRWFEWAGEHTGPGGWRRYARVACDLGTDLDVPIRWAPIAPADWTWPLPNVWLGVSVEDQQTADERVPLLLDTPAAVRWVSYEPALGPVDFSATPAPPGWTPINGATVDDLRGCLPRWQESPRCRLSGGLDWIVVGGESGPGARPFDLAWARSTIAQCRAAGVPVFVKQLGARASDPVNGIAGAALEVPEEAAPLISRRLHDRKGADPSEWPADLRVREMPEVRT